MIIKIKKQLYIQYWDVNNLYGWQFNFEWIENTSQFNKDFIKNYMEENDQWKWYFLEVNVHYFEKLHEVRKDLSFLTDRKKIEKVEKLLANVHDKTECFIHIKYLKQALNHGLVLKKSS